MAKTTPHYDLMVDILTENRPSNHTGIPPTDSDKELIIQLLQFSGACLTREQVEKIREFHFESLTRARRKLQRSGHFLPTSAAVRKKRQLMSFEIEQVAPNETAMGLQQRIGEPA
jgi:hypothetical protein